MVVWLSASWYFMEWSNSWSSAADEPDLRYEDLRQTEFASLMIVLVLLLALGTAPSRLFQSNVTTPPSPVAIKEGTWIQ